ncbi:hypothetical protein COEREDRAFT_90703 [Coemansia reversa NRRL 1564]|uniref:Uncharacterized protein n=1 Tax=Coemansia reversa (strain ATCC 12441 / NRRL 1564) TaxID=763665 RepID=A0A2G5BK57_COERN|nr:hypothetical protein COEREDRAFT_90703 [Coemansia reversa NRRL 1564]|eukprot:PIA19396.1 hypothetical protein COEREDRAFT_90703 [Coemansia reversa NRRL 1564]
MRLSTHSSLAITVPMCATGASMSRDRQIHAHSCEQKKSSDSNGGAAEAAALALEFATIIPTGKKKTPPSYLAALWSKDTREPCPVNGVHAGVTNNQDKQGVL